MSNYTMIERHNYASDRSSAEAISVGQAFTAVHEGSCQNMRVIRELDALETILAEGADESDVAAVERDVHEAWMSYQRACGAVA